MRAFILITSTLLVVSAKSDNNIRRQDPNDPNLGGGVCKAACDAFVAAQSAGVPVTTQCSLETLQAAVSCADCTSQGNPGIAPAQQSVVDSFISVCQSAGHPLPSASVVPGGTPTFASAFVPASMSSVSASSTTSSVTRAPTPSSTGRSNGTFKVDINVLGAIVLGVATLFGAIF